MQTLLSILIMLLILSVLTIVHEWGHFIAARIFKVRVVEFSIFMGPKLFQRKSKKTGTLFSVRLFPLGGYCAFEDDNGNTDSPDSLNAQPWYKRAVIFLAGVLMNLVLALVISTVLVAYSGYGTTRLASVDSRSTAAFTGLSEGDRVVKLQGIRTVTYTDHSIATYGIKDGNPDPDVMESDYTSVYRKADGSRQTYHIQKQIHYLPGGENQEFCQSFSDYRYTVEVSDKGESHVYLYDCTFISYEKGADTVLCRVKKTVDGAVISDGEEQVPKALCGYWGGDDYTVDQTKNPFKLIAYGWNEMVSMVKSVYVSLWWLITGKVGMESLSGPVGLTKVVDDVVSAPVHDFVLKLMTLLNLGALISANLAVINALPFPGLDGCHLLFIVIELLRGGKKIPPEKQGVISFIGLALLIVLAVVIMGFDVYKIVNGMI